MAVSKRSPNKIQNVLTLKHSYQYYINDILSHSRNYIDQKTYRDICQRFNEIIWDRIINQGYVFHLPYRLGIHSIRKKKNNYYNLKPDFGLFNKSEREYKNIHLNEHTGGFYARIHWNKRSSRISNISAYSFIPTRAIKRELAKRLKEDGKELINKYFE